MISETTINKVRDLDIKEVLEPYVTLTKKGVALIGLPVSFGKYGFI